MRQLSAAWSFWTTHGLLWPFEAPSFLKGACKPGSREAPGRTRGERSREEGRQAEGEQARRAQFQAQRQRGQAEAAGHKGTEGGW